MTDSTLVARMRTLAESHPRGVELLEKADALDKALDDWVAATDALISKKGQRMLGAWARARRLWCECTGEDLV